MRFPAEINQAPATAGVYILENADRTTNHVWHTDNLQQELRRIANLAADPRKGASEFSCEVIPDPKERERRTRELLHTLKPTTQEE